MHTHVEGYYHFEFIVAVWLALDTKVCIYLTVLKSGRKQSLYLLNRVTKKLST